MTKTHDYNNFDTTRRILEIVHKEDIVKACETMSAFCCYLYKNGIMPEEISTAHIKDLGRMATIYEEMKKGNIKTDDSLPEYTGTYTVDDEAQTATKNDDEGKRDDIGDMEKWK